MNLNFKLNLSTGLPRLGQIFKAGVNLLDDLSP